MPATGVQNSSHLGASVTFTMPFTFLFEEYADMIYVCRFCDGNSVLAVAEYQHRFPNRRIPNRRVFTGVYQTLRDTGRLPGVRTVAERGVNEGVNEEGIVRMVFPELSFSRAMDQTLRSPPLASQVFRVKLTGLLCVGMDERTGLQREGGNARCIARSHSGSH